MLVKDFRNIVHEKTGVEPNMQRIIYRAKKLEDEHPLSNYSKS